jgi:hypothetical protein
MSVDDFTNCMKGEYNQDEEAVRFIVQIFELGGEDALRVIKDNWAKISAASTIISTLAAVGGDSAAVKFLQSILKAVGAAAVEVLLAMLAGLALGAVLLAVEAGISCAPKMAS